ncbi:TIGR03086 family metal-binding protein [Streptomyces sp. NPDC058773]|uniref:TIGR03086 family metal-binding protein n=1 Tax=Streptomyces sp. NPDC058773 TaxID=3346632 RepID=UPI00369822E3
MHMNTADAFVPHTDFAHLRRLHARAVRDSVTLIRRVTPADLALPTPCAAWALDALLAHMTAQHHGFAAAARGEGRDPAHWSVRPPGADPAGQYTAAAESVIAAFATVDDPERACALPEFSATRTFPAVRALGFHLIDYVVHTWDVARTLDLDYAPGAELLRAALPIARAVPDGEARLDPAGAFRPGLAVDEDADTLEKILAALGRSPRWRSPERGAAGRGTGR